jgi:hypothetical protein
LTAETTISTTYTNLTTVGPAVTVVVPASGTVLVSVTAGMVSSNGNAGYMGFAASGANTSAPTDTLALNLQGNQFVKSSATFLLTGLDSGKHDLHCAVQDHRRYGNDP